jgi:8-oxo-dGTP diphosphatase
MPKHPEEKIVRVGIGVMVVKDGKVLLAKRKGAHGAGEYATPGGHLEYGESFEACAIREVMEECGLKIKNIRFIFLGNLKRYMPKHYVHVQLMADWDAGEPSHLEPGASGPWKWHDINSLPSPLFYGIEEAIESLKSRRNYFDE